MAQFDTVIGSPFSDPKDGFEKGIELLPTIGIEVWKKREIANLLLCKKTVDGHEIQCNIMFAFDGTLSIALNSQTDNEPELKAIAEEVAQVFLKAS